MFTCNGLALIGNKSEAVLFGTRRRLHAFPLINSVTIAGSQVPLSQSYNYYHCSRCCPGQHALLEQASFLHLSINVFPHDVIKTRSFRTN